MFREKDVAKSKSMKELKKLSLLQLESDFQFQKYLNRKYNLNKIGTDYLSGKDSFNRIT